MKRYRIVSFDFDARALTLDVIPDEWEESVKELHRENQKKTILGLMRQYGEARFDEKLKNFKELGPKPFSIVAFHNKIFSQARDAFVYGSYYASLTAICALGERVLNHLVLGLREHYRQSKSYQRVYKKRSFDNWTVAIDALAEWKVLTAEAEAALRRLASLRNSSLHFNLETEKNDRAHALDAIKIFDEVINNQFSATGALPWIMWAPGEPYVKSDWEDNPFIKQVYLPNCLHVGYQHKVESVVPFVVEDVEYENKIVSDVDFVSLRKTFNEGGQVR